VALTAVLGSDPERALIARCLAGEEAAWAELYDDHKAAVLRLAIGLMGPEAAEDAVQDAFVRSFANLGKLRAGTPFRAWVYRSTVWACRHATRNRRRKPAEALASDYPDDRAVDPERTLALRAAIGSLQLRDREILLLRFYVQLTEEEAAGVLGVRRGTVKSRTSRALRRLAALPGIEHLRLDG
jgi:RNA polymerase sigma factor (sigma-70 family)